jgi:hypothetical protein
LLFFLHLEKKKKKTAQKKQEQLLLVIITFLRTRGVVGGVVELLQKGVGSAGAPG